MKTNILRMLAAAGVRVTVVPAETSFEEAMALSPTGSSSQAARRPCARTYAIEVAKKAIAAKVPLFGICLGAPDHGACGRRADPQDEVRPPRREPPVEDVRTHRLHHEPEPRLRGRRKALPANAQVTHRSLFDGSLRAELTDAPAFCFQGHPEASPGRDISPLFAHFVGLIEAKKNA